MIVGPAGFSSSLFYALFCGPSLRWRVRLDDALSLARIAANLAPQSAATLDTLGWVSYLNGNQIGAGKYLYRAMSSAPANVTIHKHVAQWQKSQGQAQWAGYHREQASYLPRV